MRGRNDRPTATVFVNAYAVEGRMRFLDATVDHTDLHPAGTGNDGSLPFDRGVAAPSDSPPAEYT